MRRTFCDRCERECVNLVYVGRFSVRHTTRRHGFVDETEPESVDLCKSCAVAVLGQELADKIMLRSEAEQAQREAEHRAMEAERPIQRDDPAIPGWSRTGDWRG